MTVILEFNDLELSLYRGTERLYHAPGFAIVRDDEMLFGDAAMRLARIYPQQANQQYLDRMNGDALAQPTKTAANHADLVYLHLKEISAIEHDDVVLAVPGTLTGDQLGVLLGICQEAGITVSGFVNGAVAAVSTTRAPEQAMYIDVHLQYMLVSELTVDDQVRHQRSFEVRECSFTNLVDGWANLIADRFVRETRFDPLHTANTEQQLYNQVHDWALGAHHRAEVMIEIDHGNQTRRVEIPRSQLEHKTSQRIEMLIDTLPAAGTLILSARAARVPGLAERFRTEGFGLELVTADAVAVGCNQHMGLVRTVDDDLRLVNRLPHEHEILGVVAQANNAPSHFLHDYRAVAATSQHLGFRTQLKPDGVWLEANGSVRLNGEPLSADALLGLGDVITAGTESFTAIRLDE